MKCLQAPGWSVSEAQADLHQRSATVVKLNDIALISHHSLESGNGTRCKSGEVFKREKVKEAGKEKTTIKRWETRSFGPTAKMTLGLNS